MGALRGDVSLTRSGVSGSGRAVSWEQQTEWGKRNMLFLLYFPCPLKDTDFRYAARKCSNSRSHSLPFCSCLETTQLAQVAS